MYIFIQALLYIFKLAFIYNETRLLLCSHINKVRALSFLYIFHFSLDFPKDGQKHPNPDQLKNIYENKWLTQLGLRGACQLYWNDSPYAMINDLYPNQFKEWEFKMTPSGFWTREKALDALQWTIEEKEKLTDNHLLQQYTMKWLKGHRLWTPVVRYWNGSPYAMINNLYPNKNI